MKIKTFNFRRQTFFFVTVLTLFLVGCGTDPYKGQARHDLEGSLFSAVATDQLEMVQFLIKQGADLNAQDDDGWTPLIWCIHDKRTSFDRWYWGKRFEIAVALVENGANLNLADNKGWTPLMWAIDEGQDKIAYYLINSGADLQIMNNLGQTALNRAIIMEETDIARAIVERGAQTIPQNVIDQSPKSLKQ